MVPLCLEPVVEGAVQESLLKIFFFHVRKLLNVARRKVYSKGAVEKKRTFSDHLHVFTCRDLLFCCLPSIVLIWLAFCGRVINWYLIYIYMDTLYIVVVGGNRERASVSFTKMCTFRWFLPNPRVHGNYRWPLHHFLSGLKSMRLTTSWGHSEILLIYLFLLFDIS